MEMIDFAPRPYPYLSGQEHGTGNGLAWNRKTGIPVRRRVDPVPVGERRRDPGISPDQAADFLAAVKANQAARPQKALVTPPSFVPAYYASGNYFYPAGSLPYPYHPAAMMATGFYRFNEGA